MESQTQDRSVFYLYSLFLQFYGMCCLLACHGVTDAGPVSFLLVFSFFTILWHVLPTCLSWSHRRRTGQFFTCILFFYNFMACVAYLLVMESQTQDRSVFYLYSLFLQFYGMCCLLACHGVT